MKDNQTDNIFTQIWSLFASVKLTIFVLILLAVFSILGTFIPQNSSPDWYFHKYGELLFTIFSKLQVFDIYHSPWFSFLIMALVINIIVCSIDRLTSVWKIIFPKNIKFSAASFQRALGDNDFSVPVPVHKLKPRYEGLVSKHFGTIKVEETPSGVVIFAEKGRWTRLGVYIVHMSVVLLLSGSLVGSIAGFDGYVNIPEGNAVDHIQLTNTQKMLPLDFSIKCNDFSVTFYDSGAPEEYRSSLSIIENNQTVIQKDILVNHPLRYKGINIFQSSYGTVDPKNIELKFYQISNKKTFSYIAQINEPITLPDSMGHFMLTEFKAERHMMGQTNEQKFVGALKLTNQEPIEVTIPYPFPRVDFNNEADLAKLSIYQTSAVKDLPEEFTITFTSKETGMTYTKQGVVGAEINIPEGLGKFQIKDLKKSYTFMGRNLGEAVIGILTSHSGKSEQVFLPVQFANFDKMRQDDVIISISAEDFQKKTVSSDLIIYAADYEERYFTGLQVTKDPGVGLVYAGFILIIIGCYITFFMSHKKFYIEMKGGESQTSVRVAGSANKNKLGMENFVNKISNKLRQSA